MKMMFTRVLLLLTTMFAVAAEKKVAVQIDGEQAVAGWHFLDDCATVEGDTLKLDGTESPCRVFLKAPAFGDVTLSASYRVEKNAGVMAVGFVIGSTDSASYTYVHYDSRSAILCRSDLERSWREVKRASKPHAPDKWYTARLERKGAMVSVYFDDKLLFQSECAGEPGLVGFYASQTTARVRDITVEGQSTALARPWLNVTPPKNWIHVCTDAGAGGYEAFPDICRLADGRLLTVFYAGYGHVSLPTEKWPKGGRVSGCFSSDEGQTWSEPFTLFDGPYDDRDPSITQLKDGRLACVFFTLKPNPKSARKFDGLGSFIVTSADGGQTWETKPRQIAAGYYCSSPIRELSDGRLALGLYRADSKEACGAVTFSQDGGATWCTPIDIPTGGLRYDAETDLIELKDNTLFAALRGRGHSGWSTSKDGGKSWSVAEVFGFPGHCHYLHRAPGDIILMAHRKPKTSLHYTLDEGKTWSENVLVDNVIGAYPSMVTLKDGTILIVYYEEGRGSSIRAKRFRATRDGIEWLEAGAEKIHGAAVNQKRAEILWTKAICKQPGRYIGWPSVCLRENGELLAVFSGDRDQHVCPWGKVQMIRSADFGETWSAARNICNTPLDDRDAGILELPNNDLLVTWFTSLAYTSSIRDRAKLKSGSPRFYWWLHDEKISDAVRERWLGYYTARSVDGGKTWEKPVRVYGSANHGPALLKDGRLLMVGRRIGNSYTPSWKGVKHELPVEESRDNGRTWQCVALIEPTPPDTINQFHEPHLVKTDDGRIVAQFRFHARPAKGQRGRDESQCTLRQAESSDGGKTWTRMVPTKIQGYPPHLIKLSTGELVTVYGRRLGPHFGEYACLSDDHGRTWDVANEIKLAGHFNGDLGYPASTELPDGNILTVYYQAEKKGEKTCLMGTLWRVKK